MHSICCDPDYEFIGMKLKFMNRKIRVDMREYFRKAVEMFDEPNLTPVTSPSKKFLLNIDPDSPKAKETTRNFFHSIVMLLMHVSHGGKIDLQLAIFFCPEG